MAPESYGEKAAVAFKKGVAIIFVLTAVFFETGAMPVPTESQNPAICG